MSASLELVMAFDSERIAPPGRGESGEARRIQPAPNRLPRLQVDDLDADVARVEDFSPDHGLTPEKGTKADGYFEDDVEFGGPRPADLGLEEPVDDESLHPVNDDYDYEYDDYFDDDDDDEYLETASSVTRNALEWAVVLVGAVLVALVLRASLFQAFYIPSESMETTLMIDDRVLVNKISYRLHDINRGDIVVFTRPDDQAGDIRDLIKRVIALPGESVEGRQNSLYINGQRLEEPYLEPGVLTVDFEPTVVPEGQIFVMGDNRTESYDSRVFGPIDQDRVVGRAFVLFWPLNRIGSL